MAERGPEPRGTDLLSSLPLVHDAGVDFGIEFMAERFIHHSLLLLFIARHY